MKPLKALHRHPPQLRQRGSILVMVAGTLLVAVTLLAGTQFGYAFYAKRELQKTADLAALAGAKVVGSQGCDLAKVEALANAQKNKQSAFNTTVVPTCHLWNAKTYPVAPHFAPTPNTPNAVKVVVTGSTPSFLPTLAPITQSAQAVAAVDNPIAVFSVGTRLARVSGDSVLGATLKGVGLDLSGTSLVGYDGLAQLKVTPGGLLQALGIPVATDIGIGEFNALLAGRQIGLGQILDATATLAGRSDLLASNITLVNQVNTKLNASNLLVRLGTDPATVSGPRGLFANIIAPDATTGTALNTQVSALDIISTAIAVASQNHAVDVPSLNINLLGLVKVTSKVGVVEPPSIAIGSVGAKAYTAQVRSYTHIETTNTLLGSLLNPLVKLDLPIVLDTVTGLGTITELCSPGLQDAQKNDRASITVQSSIAKLCVGNVAPADLFSKSAVCETNLGNMELINVLGILRVDNTIKLNALQGGGTVTLKKGETGTTGNNLSIGNTVSDLITQLTQALFDTPSHAGAPTSGQLDSLAQQLFNETSNVCTANTRECHKLRLAAAKDKIETTASQSGLLSGLLGGLGTLVNSILGAVLGGDGCTAGTGLLGSGPVSDANCVAVLKGAVSPSSSAASGGNISNALAVLSGTLRPVLNAVGSTILTPLLQNVLGLHLGETDVKLMDLQCGGNARLVF